MNPTEQFIDGLVELLKRHEKDTGTYIHEISIKRIESGRNGQVRPERVIGEIELNIS